MRLRRARREQVTTVYPDSSWRLCATWEVSLCAIREIGSIVLHNRTSCCQSRLRDIKVFVNLVNVKGALWKTKEFLDSIDLPFSPPPPNERLLGRSGKAEFVLNEKGYLEVSQEMTDLFYGGFRPAEVGAFEAYLARILANLERAERGDVGAGRGGKP